MFQDNIDKLRLNIYYVSEPSIKAYATKVFTGESHESIKPKLEEHKNTLEKYLKRLESLIPSKYEPKNIPKLTTILPDIPTPKPFLEGGSYKKTNKKNILGKERCTYKITGDRKEYIKYKGNFISSKGL